MHQISTFSFPFWLYTQNGSHGHSVRCVDEHESHFCTFKSWHDANEEMMRITISTSGREQLWRLTKTAHGWYLPCTGVTCKIRGQLLIWFPSDWGIWRLSVQQSWQPLQMQPYTRTSRTLCHIQIISYTGQTTLQKKICRCLIQSTVWLQLYGKTGMKQYYQST